MPSIGGLLQLCGIRAASIAALCGTCLVAIAGTTAAQSPPGPVSISNTTEHIAAVSGNPAATTYSTGTGWLGRTLGLHDEWGITLGGLWLADTNLVAAGGAQPGGWTNNSALLIGLGIDAEKLVDWRGASFGF